MRAQDLRELDWSTIAALVLAPGVPLTHPTPHWSVEARAQGRRRGDRRHRIVLPRARANRARDCPLVAITGTNGKSTTTALIAHLLKSAGRDAQMGGNIGVPVLALEPFAPGRVYVLEVSSYQIDLAPSLQADRRHPAQRRRKTISTATAPWKTTPPSRSGCRRASKPGGTAVIGVDDRYTRAAADRIERAGKKVVRVSVPAPLRDGYYAEGTRIMRAAAGKAHAGRPARRHRLAARPAQCAERRLRGRRLRRARARSADDSEGAR